MDIRYSANQKDFQRYNTEETRAEFLIENLYRDDEVVAVYSHVDRMVTLGCKPRVGAPVSALAAGPFGWRYGTGHAHVSGEHP